MSIHRNDGAVTDHLLQGYERRRQTVLSGDVDGMYIRDMFELIPDMSQWSDMFGCCLCDICEDATEDPIDGQHILSRPWTAEDDALWLAGTHPDVEDT